MKKKLFTLVLAVLFAVLCVAGCSTEGGSPNDGENSQQQEETQGSEETQDSKVIGYSNCEMSTPYRVAMVDEFETAIEEAGLDWEVIVTDAQGDAAKQVNDMEDLMAKGVDAIVCSPMTSDTLAPVCKEVVDAGIPLILVDRLISTEDYTAYVGGDNTEMGRIAGEYIAEQIGGAGKVAMIEGDAGASATEERGSGFEEAIGQYPDIEIVASVAGDFDQQPAMDAMEDILTKNQELDAVFCQNDLMALGAKAACEAQNRTDIKIVGCDGQKSTCELIMNGTQIIGSVVYPVGGYGSVEVLQQIFDNGGVYEGEKIVRLDTPLVTPENAEQYFNEILW